MERYIIAVDGPAGSGKSTISKLVANKLKLTYLDTGAMYRMITYYFLKNNVDLEDSDCLQEILSKVKLDIRDDRFFIEGEDVSDNIRSVEVTQNVSKVAAIKIVREELVDLQRNISEGKRVILDGRDIGTVVFPDADLKIFLTASPEERARRRLKDFSEKGIEQDYQDVLADIVKRDKMDSERKESPLKKAEDAIEIDTDNLNISEVSAKIIELANKN